MEQLLRTLLSRSPRIRSKLSRLAVDYRLHPAPSQALIENNELLRNAWHSDSIPAQQRQVVEKQLAAYRRGESIQAFDALVNIVANTVIDADHRTFLDVGCSSGYYSEVLRCRNINVRYHGCDYSHALIEMARELYGASLFGIEDATRLSYASDSFDIVLSGCCLLHIPEYDKAIAEAGRVARSFVIFHRTPVLHLSGPAFYTKRAYGQEMLEIHFNEQKLVRMFHQNDLQVVDVNTHLSLPEPRRMEPLFYKTYLCRKAA